MNLFDFLVPNAVGKTNSDIETRYGSERGADGTFRVAPMTEEQLKSYGLPPEVLPEINARIALARMQSDMMPKAQPYQPSMSGLPWAALEAGGSALHMAGGGNALRTPFLNQQLALKGQGEEARMSGGSDLAAKTIGSAGDAVTNYLKSQREAQRLQQILEQIYGKAPAQGGTPSPVIDTPDVVPMPEVPGASGDAGSIPMAPGTSLGSMPPGGPEATQAPQPQAGPPQGAAPPAQAPAGQLGENPNLVRKFDTSDPETQRLKVEADRMRDLHRLYPDVVTKDMVDQAQKALSDHIKWSEVMTKRQEVDPARRAEIVRAEKMSGLEVEHKADLPADISALEDSELNHRTLTKIASRLLRTKEMSDGSTRSTVSSGLEKILPSKDGNPFKNFYDTWAPNLSVESRQAESDLRTLKERISMVALSMMKAASPTGAGAGSMQVAEWPKFESLLGNLDLAQSEEQMADALKTVMDELNNLRARAYQRFDIKHGTNLSERLSAEQAELGRVSAPAEAPAGTPAPGGGQARETPASAPQAPLTGFAARGRHIPDVRSAKPEPIYVNTPSEAATLPPGTEFIGPDGVVRRKR